MRNISVSFNPIYYVSVFIVVATSVCLFGIGSIQSQITNAQLQPQSNLTSTEQQHLLDGISFRIDNVTFSHHTAAENGIQLHYVIGGKGDPLVYYMDGQKHGMDGAT